MHCTCLYAMSFLFPSWSLSHFVVRGIIDLITKASQTLLRVLSFLTVFFLLLSFLFLFSLFILNLFLFVLVSLPFFLQFCMDFLLFFSAPLCAVSISEFIVCVWCAFVCVLFFVAVLLWLLTLVLLLFLVLRFVCAVDSSVSVRSI